MKKRLFGFDRRKLGMALAIDIATIIVFIITSLIISKFFARFMPTTLIPKDQWATASPLEMQIMTDQLQAYIVGFFSLLALFILLSLVIYNISRKLLWGGFHKKMNMEKILKYSAFNTILTLSVYLIAFIIGGLLILFFNAISYVMSFLPDLAQMLIVVYLPILVLFYLSTMIIYYLNNNYFIFKTDIKKTIKSIKDFEIKKYIIPVLLTFFSGQILTIIVYFILPQNNRFNSILILLIYALQLAYLKTMVNYYEEKKLFGIFKRG